MTALSIPERAREIAERWNGRTTLLNTLIECVTEAMHSERELCAKELDKLGAFHLAEILRDGGK